MILVVSHLLAIGIGVMIGGASLAYLSRHRRGSIARRVDPSEFLHGWGDA